ncbi:MAG: hypothetical protein Q4D96_03945 [Propionibacteriaceae bacterium]|nr:hypothetical protein [Propionibacteriaceae bacterium]
MEALTTNFGMPGVVLDHLQRISTHTFQDAQPASGRFPVLLYSPGFGSTRYESMALVTELVSHGYVVVGMDHAGTSAVVPAHTGEKIVADEGWEDNPEEVGAQWVEERTQDARLVLGSLAGTKLAGTVDLERVGFLGYSIGGGTVAETLRTDARVQAAMNLGGTFFGKVTQEGVDKPLLRFNDDPTEPEDALDIEKENEQVSKLSGAFYRSAKLTDTQHLSFNDTFAVVPLMGTGLLPHARSVEVLRHHVRDWFDHHLLGEPLQLVGTDTPDYPEVVWQY